jgi:hypothetical protein
MKLPRKVRLGTLNEFEEEGCYFAQSLADMAAFMADELETPHEEVVSVYTKSLKPPKALKKTPSTRGQAETQDLEFKDYLPTIGISRPTDVAEITTPEGIHVCNTDPIFTQQLQNLIKEFATWGGNVWGPARLCRCVGPG